MVAVPGSSLPLLHFHLHFVASPTAHFHLGGSGSRRATHRFSFHLWPPLRSPPFSILGQPSAAFPSPRLFPLPPFQFHLALAVRFFLFLFISPSKHF
jgi:hypothetical protein